MTYDSQGKYDKAIEQYERALKIKENAFGVDHINTASTIMNLGITFEQIGNLVLATTHLKRGYNIFLSSLGPQHPNTIKAKRILENFEFQTKVNTSKSVQKPQTSLKTKLRAFFK